MTQTVISIGAGSAQLPLIKAAKTMGYAVLAVDRAPSAHCAAYLDHQIVLSTYESEAVIAAVSPLQNDINFIAVVARTSGPPLETAARLANALGIPGFPMAFAQASVSKSLLRDEADHVGVATPQGLRLQTAEQPAFPAPWVVKPDAPVVGKKNVCIVADLDVYPCAFYAAQQESLNGFVEVEKQVVGADVGYMVLMQGGKIVLDLLYDEFVAFPHGHARGLGVAGPSVLAATAVETRVREAATRLLRRWRMEAGFAFFSFRVDRNGDVFLYEANPGLCGDNIADQLLKNLWSGFDPFAAEVATVCSRPVAPPQKTVSSWVVLGGQVYAVRRGQTSLDVLAQLPDGVALADDLRRLYRQVTGLSSVEGAEV